MVSNHPYHLYGTNIPIPCLTPILQQRKRHNPPRPHLLLRRVASNINHLRLFRPWKAICSSPQLSQMTLILFMNKCDLLEKNIKNGCASRSH
ncbi:hypothetical protein PILCRDRAFT_471549 [Piloderma croceum F 1598]|uniref:Uncharacterized protein n=1 Tax=Piloderma croceum (strain F 1598) TaxID=765440 RepID=A0A0C3FC70_PILCF|nr:hypothetical protein PILCRDRAFT_471549 [Piloderma croceum F 1598]